MKQATTLDQVQTTAITDPVKQLKDLIYFAKEEMVLASDVLSRLIRDDEQVGCTPTPAKPGKSDFAIIKDSELTLASKIEHLKQCSVYLKSRHDSLSETLALEDEFYSDFCLFLFKNNWFLQKRIHDQSLYLDYSFTHSGSTFNEIGQAEIQGVDIFLPHTRKSRLVFKTSPVKRIPLVCFGIANTRKTQTLFCGSSKRPNQPYLKLNFLMLFVNCLITDSERSSRFKRAFQKRINS